MFDMRASDLNGVFDRLKSAVWPHRNLISNQVDPQSSGLLNGEDFSLLRFITRPFCPKCGHPFYHADAPVNPDLCSACHPSEAFDAARAALEYDDYTKPMIFALKRAGRRHALAHMACWMHLAGADILQDADALVPVPLHYTRQVRRGFNQAKWLAAALARVTHIPVMGENLRRVKATPYQGRMGTLARRKNVADVFAVSKPAQFDGKRVILIDDVFTTGATVNACAEVLKKAGAKYVGVLTLARIVLREIETR